MGKKVTVETKPASNAVAWIALAAALGAALLLGSQLRETKKSADEMSSRLTAMEANLSKVAARVEEVAKARPAQPPRSGPDPNKVYTVRAEGAPMKGNPSAPILIAEVSDFQ